MDINENKQERDVEIEKESVKSIEKHSSKILIAVVLVLLLVIGYSTTRKTTQTNMGENSIYDSVLGEAISLNTSKANIDSIWGEPQKEGDGYLYDHEIAINYKDGKVLTIFVEWASDNGRWVAKHGITVGSSIDDIINKYGEPSQITDLDYLGTGYDYEFRDSINYYLLRFIVKNDIVKHIVITYPNG